MCMCRRFKAEVQYITEGCALVWVRSSSARGGRYGKNIIFFFFEISRFCFMVVFLFCKLFKQYSKTISPIIKTNSYKGNKILKSMVDI